MITETEWSMQNELLLRQQKRDAVKGGQSITSLLPGHQDLTPNSDATRLRLDQPAEIVVVRARDMHYDVIGYTYWSAFYTL